MRSALLLYFLETYKGFLVPPWLQLGIGNALSSGPGGDVREQILRRMKLVIAGGTIMKGADFFSPMMRPRQRLQSGDLLDHARFARFLQFSGQSWSVFEFLAGPEALRNDWGDSARFYRT